MHWGFSKNPDRLQGDRGVQGCGSKVGFPWFVEKVLNEIEGFRRKSKGAAIKQYCLVGPIRSSYSQVIVERFLEIRSGKNDRKNVGSKVCIQEVCLASADQS
jgi:hypothetical protein